MKEVLPLKLFGSHTDDVLALRDRLFERREVHGHTFLKTLVHHEVEARNDVIGGYGFSV